MSGIALKEIGGGHIVPETGCGLNRGLVHEVAARHGHQEAEGGKGRRGQGEGRENLNRAPLSKVPKLAPIWRPRGGRDSELEPLSSVGVKGTESGGKGRSIRRQFHPGLLLTPFRRAQKVLQE